MTLPPYITFASDGGQFILSLTKPFPIAQLWKFKTEKEMFERMEEFDGTDRERIEGYNIFIVYLTNLLKTNQTFDPNMATWYLEFINQKPGAHKRYKTA